MPSPSRAPFLNFMLLADHDFPIADVRDPRRPRPGHFARVGEHRDPLTLLAELDALLDVHPATARPA